MRRTLRTSVNLTGTGLHGGARCRVRLSPHDGGMVVARGASILLASWDAVRPSRLCTVLASPDDPSLTLSTVEHLMAALAGAGITDVLIEPDGPEVPILDGSALPFLLAMEEAGIDDLPGELPRMIITAPVVVTDGAARASFTPAGRFSASMSIDFPHPLIGHQSFTFDPATDDFRSAVAPARTFCMAADVPGMRASGLALGGTPRNAVVFGAVGVENPGGLRFPDEPARHKLLDALGDLHLAGAEIVGHFDGDRSGHALTNRLLRKAFTSGAVHLLAA